MTVLSTILSIFLFFCITVRHYI